MSVGTVRGDGMRANCENSSTRPFSDSTSLTMVVVHSSTSARVGRRRAAEVTLKAFGGQLDGRQRILDLVREPPRHLPPRRDFLRPDQRRHVVEHQHRAFEVPPSPASVVAIAARCSSRPSRTSVTSCAGVSSPRPAADRSSAASGARSSPRQHLGGRLPDGVRVEAEQTPRRVVHRRRCAPCASTEMTPVAMRSRIGLDVAAAPLAFEVLALEIDRAIAPASRRLAASSPAMRVERLDERTELVRRLRLDAMIEMAGADLPRGRRRAAGPAA